MEFVCVLVFSAPAATGLGFTRSGAPPSFPEWGDH